jgi:hypothetical protein
VRPLIKPDRGSALAASLAGQGPGCILLGKTLAKKIGVPYYEDRMIERFLGHRRKGSEQELFLESPRYRYKGEIIEEWPMAPDGRAVPMNEVEYLTEEVWSREYWPNTADEVPVAIKRLPDGKVTGIYYHGPSMCLVLLHPGGLKVGIRATSIIHPILGLDKVAVAAIGKLKAV